MSNNDNFNEDNDETRDESSGSIRPGLGLTDRITAMLDDEEGEGGNLEILQWIEALDLQVMGACRADERLKPLLKLNVSSDVAEDHFLAHLTRHFEVSEVGLLARCLCVPLVSVRIGKVISEGTRLCPTATRGNLNLSLLPSSDLRISFVGDDGHTERLATLGSGSEVSIEEISADKSGRSFLMMFSSSRVLYFWCSETSKIHGSELLEKMKDLLTSKPSLSQLTGISDSRLDCFASHLRAYLLATAVNNKQVNSRVLPFSALNTASDSYQRDLNTRVFSSSKRSSQTAKGHSLYQGILSPRPNSFKDPAPRSCPILKSGVREKFKRDSLLHKSSTVASTSRTEASSSSNKYDKDIGLEVNESHTSSSLSFLQSLGSVFPPLPSTSSLDLSLPQFPTTGSFFSPYYCLCPPSTSTLQYTITPLNLPTSTTQPLSLLPLSTLLSDVRSSSSLNVQSKDFPIFLPDPLVRLPCQVSSFRARPSLQQFPTFTPLMCDPIVHIPVVDVCSSGGYFVSSGPSISSNIIPPLCPNLVNPLITDSESAAEKSARETLRMLLSQTNQQFSDASPPSLTSSMVVGSSVFYSNSQEAITNSIGAMGLVPLPERAVRFTAIGRNNSFIDRNLEIQEAEGSEDHEELKNPTLLDDAYD